MFFVYMSELAVVRPSLLGTRVPQGIKDGILGTSILPLSSHRLPHSRHRHRCHQCPPSPSFNLSVFWDVNYICLKMIGLWSLKSITYESHFFKWIIEIHSLSDNHANTCRKCEGMQWRVSLHSSHFFQAVNNSFIRLVHDVFSFVNVCVIIRKLPSKRFIFGSANSLLCINPHVHLLVGPLFGWLVSLA